MKAERTEISDEDDVRSTDDHRQQPFVRSQRWKIGQDSNAVYAVGPSKLVTGLLTPFLWVWWISIKYRDCLVELWFLSASPVELDEQQ